MQIDSTPSSSPPYQGGDRKGTIGRNVFSMGLSRIISGIIIFVVYIKLVTYLGPTEFGKFALVLTYYIIFSLLLDLGISKYAIKKISEDKSQAIKFTGNFFVAQFVISLVVLGFFILIPRVLGYDADVTAAMLLAGIGLFVNSIQNPFSALVQAYQKMHVLALFTFIHTIINAVWLLLLIYTGKSFVFAFWLYMISGVIGFAIYYFVTADIFSHKLLKTELLEKSLVRKMIVYGIPFAFISSFEILIAKADSIIQKFFLPYSDVGLYAGAYRFVDALTFIPAVIAISLFPYLASHVNLQEGEVRTNIERWNRYLMFLAIPMGVGATILADRIVLTLFDQRFAGSIPAFQILIWATVIIYVYTLPNVIMIVKKTKAALWVLSAVAIFNIIANVIFIPSFGIIASAWLTVVSYLLVGIFYIHGSRKLLDFTLWRYAFWPILASVPMGLLVWQLRGINLLINAGIGAVVYFAILIITRYLTSQDLVFIKSIFRSSQPHPQSLSEIGEGRER